MESRWIKILKDIANDKRKLTALKAKSKGKDENKGIFKRIFEIVTVDNSAGNQAEMERNIKGLQLMQDETYMSRFWIRNQ